MLLKIFMKRKNTKIYFIIVLLFALLFSCTIILKNYYIQNNNDINSDSYIYVPVDMFIQDTNIKYSLKINAKFDKNNISLPYYIIDNNIPDNTIYEKNKNTHLYAHNSDELSKMTIVIKDDIYTNIIYLNENTFNKLNTNCIDGYYMKLSDWSEIEDFEKLYNSKYDNQCDMSISSIKYDFIDITKLLKLLVNIILVLVIILYIFIIVDLILDGIKKSSLFYTLGMTKSKIVLLSILEFIIYIIEFIGISYLILLIF